MASEATSPNKMTRCLVGRLPESIQGFRHILHFSDELLMEILRRLPNSKSVMQCKCVCKRWAALTSHPWFIFQFIGLKFKHETFAIVTWYKPDRYGSLWQGSESFFRPSIFNARDSDFSPLYSLEDDSASATIVASCSDLLLYCRHEWDKQYNWYISNVQTRQWVELPSPPYYYGRVLFFGLICDPFYSCEREVVLNDACRFSVVAVHCGAPSTKLKVHVFSSINHCESQWCDRVLSLPRTCTFWQPCSGFCFDGKLHFTCREGIFGFDQNSIEFDDEIQGFLIHWPVGMSLGCHFAGYSQENLTVSKLGDAATLRVWVLKDYKTGDWMLRHKVETHDWVSQNSWMTEKLEKFSHADQAMLMDILGFHPSNSNVIYVLVPGYIFLCNLSTKTLGLACRIPVAVARRRKHYLKNPYKFLLMLPSWPTPLPHIFQDGVNASPLVRSGLLRP